MKRYRRWVGILLGAVGLVLLVAAWLVFAPVPFGGQSSYAIVNGNSMEPLYAPGDLVIVKKAPVYQVGDVVAFFDSQLNHYVIHRIVAEDDGLITTKGDHNGWIDPDRTPTSAIVGKAWIPLGVLGPVLVALRRPFPLALLAGLAGLLLVAVVGTSTPRKQGGRFLNSTHGLDKGLVLGRLAEAKEVFVFLAAVLGAA